MSPLSDHVSDTSRRSALAIMERPVPPAISLQQVFDGPPPSPSDRLMLSDLHAGLHAFLHLPVHPEPILIRILSVQTSIDHEHIIVRYVAIEGYRCGSVAADPCDLGLCPSKKIDEHHLLWCTGTFLTPAPQPHSSN